VKKKNAQFQKEKRKKLKVLKLREEGKSIQEIAKIIGIGEWRVKELIALEKKER